MLIGRAAEVGALTTCLDDAGAGQASRLRLVAEPGLGKTALLDEVSRLADARGFRVVRLTALEMEAGLPAAGLSILLPRLGCPPEGSTTALLEAVQVATRDRPLLLTIDDVQWLDAPSLRAVAFASRRLLADPVAIVIAGRSEIRSLPALEGFPLIDVPPLSESDGMLLLRQSMPTVPDVVARRVVDALGGVPLALAEAASFIAEDALSGAASLPSPVPVSRRVQERYARGFEELRDEERFAVVVLASDGSGDAAVIYAALSRVALSVHALQGAERAGLVELGGDVRFMHPLARSAVHSAAEPSERRRAHALLAEVYEGRGDTKEAIRHRVAAAVGPDEVLAAALEVLAHETLAQFGGAEEGVALALLGAEMATDPLMRGRLLTLAAEHASAEEATVLIDRVTGESRDPQLHARCTLLRVQVDSRLSPKEGARLLVGLDAAALGPEFERQRDVTLVFALMNGNDTAGLVRFASRFDDEGRTLDTWHLMAAAGFALTFLGEHRRAVPLLRRATEMTRVIDPWDLPSRVVSDWAIIPGWLGEDAEHGRRFRLMDQVLRASGRPEDAMTAAFFMNERHRREGAWSTAEALLHEAIGLGQAMNANCGVEYVRLASLLSYRGDEAGTSRALRLAQGDFDASGERWAPLWLAQARGSLALSLGRPHDAIRALEDLVDVPFLGRGARDAVSLGLVDLVEAFTLAGLTTQAGAVADDLARRLDGIEDPLGPALVARCRALTSSPEADAYLSQALEQHRLTSEAFEEARTELHLGEHLRRTRRPKQSREPLTRALAGFERVGVEPWAERARQELRASGRVIGGPASPPAAPLTPQELRVAMAVREGLTNVEVSNALFLSVKTVEFHLGRAYRKLGIRSRGGLAAALERAGIV